MRQLPRPCCCCCACCRYECWCCWPQCSCRSRLLCVRLVLSAEGWRLWPMLLLLLGAVARVAVAAVVAAVFAAAAVVFVATAAGELSLLVLSPRTRSPRSSAPSRSMTWRCGHLVSSHPKCPIHNVIEHSKSRAHTVVDVWSLKFCKPEV